MPDVRMPDGTVIKNVPEGTTKSELTRRLQAAQQAGQGAGAQMAGQLGQNFEQPPTVQNSRLPRTNSPNLQAMGQGFASRLLGNAANVPDVVANLGARSINQAARPLMRAGQALTGGGDKTDMSQFRGADIRDVPMPNRPDLINTPTVGQEFVPGPTGEDLQGAVQRLGEGAAALRTGDFGQFNPEPAAETQGRLNQELQEESPAAFFMGQIGGDVMTLITGRSPVARSRGRAQVTSRVAGERAAHVAGRQTRGVEVAPTVKAALERATKGSKGVRTLANRMGRAAETGLEGAALSALNGEADPAQAFGFAAGTQMGGSLLLSGMSGLFSGGFSRSALKLGVSAAAIGSAAQLFKTAAPGGQNFILESIETGFDKVALGLAAGAISGASGLGRVTRGFPVRAAPQVADMITSIPRGAMLSTMTTMLEDPASEAVVNKVASDPMYFDPASRRRIERAILSEDVSLTSTIDDLMKNRQFREKFEQIGQ